MKFFFFFYGLPVGGTNEKKKNKTNRGAGNWNGLLPIFQFESRYNFCIVTQGSGGRARGGHDTISSAPQYGQHGPRHSQPRARAYSSVHVRGLVSRGVAIQMLYRGWGRPLGHDTTRNTEHGMAYVSQYSFVS